MHTRFYIYSMAQVSAFNRQLLVITLNIIILRIKHIRIKLEVAIVEKKFGFLCFSIAETLISMNCVA